MTSIQFISLQTLARCMEHLDGLLRVVVCATIIATYSLVAQINCTVRALEALPTMVSG